MRDRGPDSAGFASYDTGAPGRTRITVLAEGIDVDWGPVAAALEKVLDAEVTVRGVHDHAVFSTDGDGRAARQWIIDNVAGASVLSYGSQIELYKAVGDPDLVAERYDLASRTGTHALAHTRMATESAVTTTGSHPFATGADTCLVHNGVAVQPQPAAALPGGPRRVVPDRERLRGGRRLPVVADALGRHHLAGPSKAPWRTSTASTRSPSGWPTASPSCATPSPAKPAVVAETDDWVAMSSEYRAIARLPGAVHAEVWEPEPARIYTWSLAA